MKTLTKTWVGLLLGACASGVLAATPTFITSESVVKADRFAAALQARQSGAVKAPEQQEPKLKMVANADIRTKLSAGKESFEVSGRTSMSISGAKESLEGGDVMLDGLNVLFNDVPQAALTHGDLQGPKQGTLGFAADAGQTLRYDPKNGLVEGKVTGYIDAPYMSELTPPLRDDYEDYVETPRQRATLSVRMQLERALDATSDDKPLQQIGKVSMSLDAVADERLAAFDLRAELYEATISIEHVFTFWWEVAKQLCVQPVRIGWFTFGGFWPPIFQVHYTGDGLNFGMPGANTQWAKADVIFNVRDWKTVWNSQYVTFDSSEATALKGEVDDADCVEVFFVRDFSPASMWGGGATWGLGTANTKIISSDGNAVGGIDLTHLAHEVGHAIGLPHPTGAAGVSTNTLMCPSGWMNDNPKRNSQENKDNITNPLFTFALKFKSAGPDCTASGDCGACP